MGRIFYTLSIVVALILGTPASVRGEEGSVEAPSDVAASTPVRLADTFSDIDTAWSKLTAQLQSGDLATLQPLVTELHTLRVKAGLDGLEEDSIVMLSAATSRVQRGEREIGAYLAQQAIALSPESARVKLNSLSLVSALGFASPFEVAREGIALIPGDAALVATILMHTLYPVAWSFTIALYVVFVLFSFFWLVEILRRVAHVFPISIRGIASPIVTLCVLAGPIFFGPIVCLVVWACFLWALDRRRKWPCYLTGLVLCVWGAIAPVRERIGMWISEPGTQALLNYSNGTLGGADRFRLEQAARASATDSTTWFSYGQLLRRYGEYSSAVSALNTAASLSPDTGWILAERGVARSLAGDVAGARADMAAAEAAGMKSAEFFFNYSKIVFDEFDTESVRAYLSKSARADPDAHRDLTEREVLLGEQHPWSFANVRAPLSNVLAGMWGPRFAPTSYRVSKLCFGLPPIMIGAVGVILCLLPVVFGQGRVRRRLSPYYAEYAPSRFVIALTRVIPGGPWVVANRPVIAFFPLAIICFLVMPLLGWPAEGRWISELYSAWLPVYGATVSIITLSVVVAGLVASEE